MAQDLIISTNYPGGNIKVISQDANIVKVEQDLRDTMEWWFYWNFCVENAPETEIVFEFTNGEVVGPWGPAVSTDGVRWEWLGSRGLINRQSFRYQFSGAQEKVYFAFSIPYQVSDFERFYSLYQNHPLLKREILTLSEAGRPIPLLKIGADHSKNHIVFTCRHHACESTAAYLLEGLLTYLLQQKDSFLLRNFLIHVVPFVDIDGVEEGDQGKSRAPHDHNRDYIQKPIYTATSALMNYIKPLQVIAGIDFHSPFKWGERHDYPFFVKQPSPHKEEIEKLGKILSGITNANSNKDKILYQQLHDIEMGEEWNQPGHPTCSSVFVKKQALLACTFEFPYFGIGSTVYTQKNSRNFGMDFGKALETYFK